MSAVPAVTVIDDAPWRQFICRACGFIYDERLGDPDGGLEPGTRYEDIPDDWACPLCGVSKADFDPYDGPSARSSQAMPVATRARPSRGRRGVVIVGGGLAGWSAARALRRRDADIPITIVAADAADVYSKPALSLAFGQRKSMADLVVAFGADVANELSLRLVPHAFATSIDAPRKHLRTTRGTIEYDDLVLATGARPMDDARLPSDLCWRINALDTWTRLNAVLARGPARVTVIGAGLVGCELADDLAHAGHAVSVLDPADRPLTAWAAPIESQRLLDGWKALGVRFTPGVSIVSVERRQSGGRDVVVVRCNDDSSSESDVVIAAIGLTVDRRLARTAGLAIDAGIAIDEITGATSVASIYAIGDCISIAGKPCRFIEPIARQAEAIAAAILKQRIDRQSFRTPLVRLKTRSAPMTLTPQR